MLLAKFSFTLICQLSCFCHPAPFFFSPTFFKHISFKLGFLHSRLTGVRHIRTTVSLTYERGLYFIPYAFNLCSVGAYIIMNALHRDRFNRVLLAYRLPVIYGNEALIIFSFFLEKSCVDIRTSTDVRPDVTETVIRVRVRNATLQPIVSVTTNIQQLHDLSPFLHSSVVVERK